MDWWVTLTRGESFEWTDSWLFFLHLITPVLCVCAVVAAVVAAAWEEVRKRRREAVEEKKGPAAVKGEGDDDGACACYACVHSFFLGGVRWCRSPTTLLNVYTTAPHHTSPT